MLPLTFVSDSTAWPAGTACASSDADQRSRSTWRTVTARAVGALPVMARRNACTALPAGLSAMICRSVTSRASVHSLPHTSAKSCPSQGVTPDSAIRQPVAPSSGPRSGRGTSSRVRRVSSTPALADRSRWMPRTDSG